MDWFLHVFFLVFGLVALYYGAEWLVGGSSQLALRLGLTPLVIGLTVVAFGTSAPEMFVSVGFNMQDLPDSSVGNVVGSNICNLALILGVSALIRPLAIKGQILKREMPILIGASVVLILMLWDKELNQIEGGILAVGIVVYVVTSLRIAKTAGSEISEEFEKEFGLTETVEGGSSTPVKFTLLIIAGLIGLVVGAKLLQVGAVFIADKAGVSDAVIGLTVLAFGTSLPELATSIVACMKNEGDIVAGNAVGSSIFNILAILGVTASIKTMVITNVEPADFMVMLVVTVLVVPMMATRSKLGRTEGVILVVGYLSYVIYLGMRTQAAA